MITTVLRWQQEVLEPLPDRQRFVAVGLAVGILVLVIELVRRRKLREEYSWVWVGIAAILIVLALQGSLLVAASQWIGAASVTSTLFFFGVVFLMLLSLQFSVRLSRLTHRHRTIGQRVALLETELARLRGERLPSDGAVPMRAPPSIGSGKEEQLAKDGTG